DHQRAGAQEPRRGARLDDPEQDPGDLRLVDGELLGELTDHVARRLLTGQHESDHRDAEQHQRDQAYQEEEGEAGAHEEAVGGDETRDSPSRGDGHNWRKKWARSPPFTSNRRILLSRITSRVSASPGS